ncbi:MAG: hypothetical protein KDB40_12565 [Acidimicrobiales bacterium]|nr:hypothetical protein [Acidimicrobiales bacterium]MCB9394343.1 hypothetical protein [Acidimicrobiaceae bacterium]
MWRRAAAVPVGWRPGGACSGRRSSGQLR